MFGFAANWTFILLRVFLVAARNLYLCSQCPGEKSCFMSGHFFPGGNTAKGEDGRSLASGIGVNIA